MTGSHDWLEARFADIRPRALAALTRQFRDLERAEEAFSAACMRAVQVWPERGLPKDPFAWLLTAGRNAGIDRLRREQRLRAVQEDAGRVSEAADRPASSVEAALLESIDTDGLRDDVLRLLFICCHPDLSPQDQSVLALRIVAGLSVPEIARAFLVKPKTMEQRLTRAKRTALQADIPFETPDLQQRHERLGSVCLMVYLMFNEGWSASAGEVQIRIGLCDEAIRIARLLLDLFPGVSELMGLLALFLFQHARREARLDSEGDLVPLGNQDRSLWDRPMIAEADALLDKAMRRQAVGAYQIQAAIAAVHSATTCPGETDWTEIERLYAALYRLQPTPVVKLNHAAAVAEVEGPAAALLMLDAVTDQLGSYRWFHGARAAFLEDLGDFAAARAAYETALALGPTGPERRQLLTKIQDCQKKL